MVRRLGSRFDQALMSGWSQRITAIIAPRREPADMTARHIASQMFMKESGPEGHPRRAPLITGAPLGRSVEKS